MTCRLRAGGRDAAGEPHVGMEETNVRLQGGTPGELHDAPEEKRCDGLAPDPPTLELNPDFPKIEDPPQEEWGPEG